MEQFRAAGSIVGWTYYLALKAESLQLAGRTAETLAAIRESEARTERFGERAQRAKPNCIGSAACFSRLLVPTMTKSKLPSAKPPESQRSRSRFR